MLPLLTLHDADALAVPRDLHTGRRREAVQLLVLRHAEVRERVCVAPGGAEIDRLTRLERSLDVGLERLARKRHEVQHDAEVYDVTAVAPPVAPHEARKRKRVVLAVQPVSRTHPADELLHDRAHHERPQG